MSSTCTWEYLSVCSTWCLRHRLSCCAFAVPLLFYMCCTVTTAEPEAMSQPRLRTTIAAVWAATADNGCRTAKEAGPSMHCERGRAGRW